MWPDRLEEVVYFVARHEQMEGILPPPPGVTPNFDHPISHAHSMLVASIVCPILAAVFVAARCSSKAVAKTWGWDDCEMASFELAGNLPWLRRTNLVA